jgi:TPP-dependent indolepyruvate ferredoxin oxidoreductase alpha subunit
VPRLGPREPDHVGRALAEVPSTERPTREWKQASTRPGHLYSLLFDVLRDIRYDNEGLTVHGCVGSCIAAAYPPWQVLDSAVNLGSAINVAAGAALAKGRPAIALIGDYGLMHSGVAGHDQVYQRSHPVVTVVLANGTSDKTGGQPSPAAPTLSDGDPVDIRRVLTRVAPEERVIVTRIDEHDGRSLYAMLDSALATAPTTIVLEAGIGIFHNEGRRGV